MRGQRSISSLVSHAKRHYHIKQYACPVAGCGYSSAESTHVRAHVKTKHKAITHDMAPIDNKWESIVEKRNTILLQERTPAKRLDGSHRQVLPVRALQSQQAPLQDTADRRV